jgi:hypothetical protein
MLIQPIEAWAEVGPSAANGGKRDWLTCLIEFGLLNFGVEVENVHRVRPLAFDDRTDLRLEKPELPGAYGPGAIDSDCDLSDSLVYYSGQVEP